MRVLVCGGRDFADFDYLCNFLDELHSKDPFTLLIHGDAPGADRMAGAWASNRGIPVQACPAKWGLHGRAAGPIRNREMLEKYMPDLLVAFPGGKGTRDMVERTKQWGGIPYIILERKAVGQ